MKATAFIEHVPEFTLSTSPWYVLTHAAAVLRKNDYKFVTKKDASTSTKLATYAAAEANALTFTHKTDIEQVDIDFIECVKAYWDNNPGPNYIQNAQHLKNATPFNVKILPTLCLLLCEYLRQQEKAISNFNKLYKEQNYWATYNGVGAKKIKIKDGGQEFEMPVTV